MSINKVILVGNVGKDPVVRYFDKGVAKATFPLATSETYTNQQGETITSTEWHNIVLWRSLAEVAEKTIKKGAQVYIVGKIKTRSYVDKDGVNKYITEILADAMLLLEKKQSPGSAPQYDPARGEFSDRPSSPVNEAPQQYNSDRENISTEYPGNENPSPKGSRVPDNEDDLPF
jgi:single-strand DNA-binding protein